MYWKAHLKWQSELFVNVYNNKSKYLIFYQCWNIVKENIPSHLIKSSLKTFVSRIDTPNHTKMLFTFFLYLVSQQTLQFVIFIIPCTKHFKTSRHHLEIVMQVKAEIFIKFSYKKLKSHTDSKKKKKLIFSFCSYGGRGLTINVNYQQSEQ